MTSPFAGATMAAGANYITRMTPFSPLLRVSNRRLTIAAVGRRIDATGTFATCGEEEP